MWLFVYARAEMVDGGKTRAQLLEELAELQRVVADQAGSLESEVGLRTAELERQARRQEALLHINQAVQQMVRSSDMERVAKVCLGRIGEIGVNAQAMAINRLRPQEMRVDTYRVGPEGLLFFFEQRHKSREGALVKCWQSGSTRYGSIERDGENWELFREKFGGLPIRSYIDVPFSLGVISAHSTHPDAFSESDEIVLKQVGEILSVGISRMEDLQRLESQTRALQESEERLNLALETASDGLYDWDMRTNETYFSPRYYTMLGYETHEMPSSYETWEGLLHPDDRAYALNTLNEYIEKKRDTYEIECRLRAKSGEWRWILSRGGITEWDADGKPIRMVGTHVDITERKRLEQELIRTQRFRAIGELSAGVSHNLNNILTGVIGPAQMLKMQTADPAVLREAEDIIASTLRARDLVHRLHLSTRGLEEDTLQPVAVGKIVQEAINTTRPRWRDESEARGISIDVVTELGETPPIRGTETRLHDIFVNLFFNAVDAMPEGGTITVATQTVKDRVQITVSDTGIGMDEETRRRAFEPFFTTKMDVGSGLGLSTAYGAVTRWGGHIDVDSEPGKGTAFIIQIPVWTDPDAQEEEAVEQRACRSGKVLIVEDDAIVCKLLSRLLSGDHEVEIAQDGQKALAAFAPGRYDVALIDLGMPGMPGEQILREMVQADPSLVSVLITGWELLDGDPRLSLFDFRVQKPFVDLEKLQDVVAQAVALHDEREEE